MAVREEIAHPWKKFGEKKQATQRKNKVRKLWV